MTEPTAPDPAPDDVDADADDALELEEPVEPTVDEALVGRSASQDPEVPA